MSLKIPMLVALLALAALTVERPVAAAESPLAAIPDDASVVVRWKTPKQAFEKTRRLVNQIDAELGEHMQGAGTLLGVLVSNPTLAGVDEKGDWWAAVFPAAEAEPGIVFIVPTTDAEATRQAVGGEFHFMEHGNWLLYTDKQPLAGRIQARIGGGGQSIEPVIDAEARRLFDAGELSVFVNVRRLVEIYKAALDGGVEQVEAQLSMMENLPVATPGFDIGAIVGIYRTMFRGLVQGLRDSETLTVAVSTSDQGFAFEELLTARAGSATAKVFERHKPSDLDLLGRMPADRLAYLGFHGDVQGFTEWAARFQTSMLPDSAEVQKATRELVEGFKQVKLGDYAMAVDLAELETGFVRSTTVTEVDAPEKLRELSRKTAVRLGTVNIGEFKQEVELRTNAESYGPYQADITTIRQQFGQDNPLGPQEQMMQMMFGPEGLTTRIVYTRDTVVQTMGGGRQTMEAALKALAGQRADSAAGQAEFQAVRRQVAPQANLVAIVDVAGGIADVVRLVSASGIPVPLTPDDVKQLDLERSFAGFSLTSGTTTLRAKTWIPLEQAQAIAKVVRTIERAANQPEF